MSEMGEPHSPEPAQHERSPWNIYGPYFPIDVASRELGMNDTEVRDLIDGHVLLGVVTTDGTTLLPAKQFLVDDEGNIDIPLNLAAVLGAWDDEVIDGWTFLGALASPQTWLDGQTVFESVRNGEHLDVIVGEIDSWMRRAR